MSIRKGTIGAALIAVSVVMASGLAVYWILLRTLPDSSGTLEIPGLYAPVEVFRDERGVPHILAANEHDMYAAAGFVHAQDRLWQMDAMRRYARGRLAEILGTRAVSTDRLMRTVGLGRIADSLWQGCTDETRAILEAYSSGVNAEIERTRGRYPVEFDLLQYMPEAWTPSDCIVISRLIGWELSLSWWSDLTLGDLAARLGEEKAREVFPFDDPRAQTIMQNPHMFGATTREFQSAWLHARTLLGSGGSAIGSNCWAVTASKSATGLPILANDTHLPHTQPSRWYAMHMHCPGMNVAGVSIAGAPGIVAGHNDNIAWGVTNAMVDDVDFYRERVSFADSTYEYRGARHRLAVRVDSILVRDSAAVELIVYETTHGPLIDGVHSARQGPATAIGAVPVSMRWAGRERSDEILALARVNRAADWNEFVAGLRTFALPGQNFTYADRSGAIGYALAARIPLRSAASAIAPADGWDAAGDWRGFVAYDDLPRAPSVDSASFANANNPVARDLPYFITGLWESDARVARIRRLLGERKKFAARDFRLMQMDATSESAPVLRDAFVAALLRMPSRPMELTRAMNILAQWDGRMAESSIAAAVFNASVVQLAHATLEDEMGAATFKQYVTLTNLPARVLPRLLADTAATWFDDVHTPGKEARDDIVRKSVMLALLDLSRRLGPSMGKWTWGALHTATFRHPLGESPRLSRLLNIGPMPLPGNASTINNSEYAIAAPYAAVIGPAMRLIVDVASLDTCLIVLPGGQSGQPLSEHYSDQTVLWQNGAYHRLVTSVEAIRRSSWPRLLLTTRG